MNVVDSLDELIVQQEIRVRQEQEFLEALKEARLKAGRSQDNGGGTPDQAAREKAGSQLALVVSKAEAKPRTNADALAGALNAVGGGPLHVDQIIEQVKTQFGLVIDKRLAASTLRKKANKGSIFKAHGGNRFSLLVKSVAAKATA